MVVETARPARGPIDLVLPPRSTGKIAADDFPYTGDGDVGERKRLRDSILPLIAPDPRFARSFARGVECR
ncbi:hypothetical protein AB2L57_05395 [Microbacterium sp. HA-8]|uniref:hypothetical protein n=1 Tax=Microbacterium sp. HA-8 TaxID=3234200 RepID=UPI0038F6FBD1